MGFFSNTETCWACGGKGWRHGPPVSSRHYQGDYIACTTCGGKGSGNSLRDIKKGSGKIKKTK